jgi:hypothetical protein
LLAAEDDKLEQPRGGFSRADVELLRQKRATAATRWRTDYYKESPKDRRPIGSLLPRFGMTGPQLYAEVFERNSDVLQMFERMIAARERGRRKLRNEDDRCRQRAEMKRRKGGKSEGEKE